jgi:hypothetical protein
MSMIDVIVVAHTSPHVLEATIQSLMCQTNRPSIVVVDIGAQAGADVTRSPYLDGFLGHAGCQYIASPGTNRFAAINQGIAACTGQYVMVLHEGDKLADCHVLQDGEKHIHSKGHPDVVYGERVKYIGPHWYHKKCRRPDQVGLGMFVELSCMMIRRELFANVSFDASYTEAGDYAFVCQLMKTCPKVRWDRFARILTFVVLDKMHEGNLAQKLREDWHVQRTLLRQGAFARVAVFLTRLISQSLRKLTRLLLGYPGYNTGVVPVNEEGRIAI